MIEIACAGAPRDLGLDQGRACAAALRARFARRRRRERLAFRLGRGAAALRDVQRHFPHQAESLDGIARAARVPQGWLAGELVREASRGEAAALAAARPRRGGVLVRSARPAAVLRRSRPEGGFRSLEIALPWLAAALAGVNEAGLAVAALGGPLELRPGAAPAPLLTQDCLRRLDSLEAALEWCLARPCSGRATLLLADARGEAAAVEFAGGGRRVRRSEAGGLLEAGAADGLAKSLAVAPPADPDGLAGAFAARLGACVALDPAGRRLALVEPQAPPRWHRV